MLAKPELRRGKLYWGMEGGEVCPYCKVGTIIKKSGRFGSFFGCSTFPGCAFTEAIPKTQNDDEF